MAPKFALEVISLSVSGEGSRTQRMMSKSFNGPGLEVVHVTFNHIPLGTPKRKVGKHSVAACPGGKGSRFDERLTNLCHCG